MAGDSSTPKHWNVYVITCLPTGIQYVGQTRKPVFLRWAHHIVGADRTPSTKRQLLHAAICEHRDEAFKVEIGRAHV